MTNPPSPSPDTKKPVNRREFLNLAWLASLGFFTANIAGMTVANVAERVARREDSGLTLLVMARKR